MRHLLAGLAAALCAASAHAQAPTVEDFAALPTVQDVALSPDGRRLVALVNGQDGARVVRLFDFENGRATARDEVVNVTELKARAVAWATDDRALIWITEKMSLRHYRESDIEVGGVFSWNLADTPRQLLVRSRDIGINASLSNVIASVPGENAVLMSAYAAPVAGNRMEGGDPAVFQVDLDDGRGQVVERAAGVGWAYFLADHTGVRARVDFNDAPKTSRVFAYRVGRAEQIYEFSNSPRPELDILGLTPDGASLAVSRFRDDGGSEVRTLSLADGTLSEPIFAHPSADITGPIIDNRSDRILGFAVSGVGGRQYVFFDPELQTMMSEVAASLPASAVRPVSWSDDHQTWLFYAEGGDTAGVYLAHDRRRGDLTIVAGARPAIPSDRVAQVLTIEYAARDGLKIPSLLTLPIGVEPRNLPTIILPHGGPESHDSYGWHWMAQYFANQGYAVLQPNFRGSNGFGETFARAGYGEWGRAMQDDLSDGVAAMAQAGYTDPDRVCIVGWSYGGYAALAGAVFTPELYRCVIAGAPVSDLNRMLRDATHAYGRSSWVVDYWREVMEGPDAETRLRDVSPVRFAENVRAPVLLIHGRDDTVVEIDQSTAMRNALRRADKSVEFVELRGEDHWLSVPETRVEAMRAMDAFLKANLGPGATPGGG